MNTQTSTKALFLCMASEVTLNSVKRIEIPAMPPLAVYNQNGKFYVTNDTCTHAVASLSEGELEDHVIECPYHQGAFDIRTGEAVAAPCRIALRTYPVTLEDERICIDLPD